MTFNAMKKHKSLRKAFQKDATNVSRWRQTEEKFLSLRIGETNVLMLMFIMTMPPGVNFTFLSSDDGVLTTKHVLTCQLRAVRRLQSK